jgi:hypothetical protein
MYIYISSEMTGKGIKDLNNLHVLNVFLFSLFMYIYMYLYTYVYYIA